MLLLSGLGLALKGRFLGLFYHKSLLSIDTREGSFLEETTVVEATSVLGILSD